MRSALALAATLSLLALAPAVAHACPGCAVTGEGRAMFTLTFFLLTFLPLLTMGGVIYWLYRRAKHAERERDRAATERAETSRA